MTPYATMPPIRTKIAINTATISFITVCLH